ncbi:hypothetical protein Efla_002109 [Eimeria flavescens]
MGCLRRLTGGLQSVGRVESDFLSFLLTSSATWPPLPASFRFSRQYTSSLLRDADSSKAKRLHAPFSPRVVAADSRGNPTESHNPSPATAASRQPFTAPHATLHAEGEEASQAAVCSVHPLEQLLFAKDLTGQWLQLLRPSCAGLPLPLTRTWGGSYREVTPRLLPPPLRLSLSSFPTPAATAAAARAGEAGETAASPLAAASAEGGGGSPPSSQFVGEGPPPPAASQPETQQLLPREVLLGLVRCLKTTHLLPLQQLALPLLLQRQTDVLLAAPAATGKSLAAAAALVCRLTEEARAARREGGAALKEPGAPLSSVRALLLLPTRDMAIQAKELLGALSRFSPLRIDLLVGRGPGEGPPREPPWLRFEALQRQPPHVLVCTPGKAEELSHFLLAAAELSLFKQSDEQRRKEGSREKHLLSECQLMVVEEAALQLQQPLMLRAVAKLKELMHPDHQCLWLTNSLSWELRSVTARLSRIGALCINCLDGPSPPTAASLQQQQQPLSRDLLPPPAGIQGTAAAAAAWRLQAERQNSAAAAAAGGGGGAAAAFTAAACRAAEQKAAVHPCAEQAASCIQGATLQQQALWGPKRSGEFFLKKQFELQQANQKAAETDRLPDELLLTSSTSSNSSSSSRRDEYLLYSPELHGHLLFNLLVREAAAAAREGEAAAEGEEKRGGFRRVLLFFSSTKSLQFHYAFFKHLVFPRITQLLRVSACSGEGEEPAPAVAAVAAAAAAHGGSPPRFACPQAEGWPAGAPLPSCFALHSRLSDPKRRAVVAAFASDSAEACPLGTAPPGRGPLSRGLKVLFCTELAAVGLQLGSDSGCDALLLQVGAPRSVEVYVQRAASAPRSARRLLLLSDLDGHFLFECKKEEIPLSETPAATALPLLQPSGLFAAALGGRAETVAKGAAARRLQSVKQQAERAAQEEEAEAAADREGREGEKPLLCFSPDEGMLAAASGACEEAARTERLIEAGGIESATSRSVAACERSGLPTARHQAWLEVTPLRASCELMYRSLLGMYAMQSTRLKYERWQVPSFLNALLLSFGLDEPPAVTKQMAARLQLLQAPGLTVNYHATPRTELLACLPSFPGFLSRMRQMQAEGAPSAEAAAAFSWISSDPGDLAKARRREGGSSPSRQPGSAVCSIHAAAEEEDSPLLPHFAPVKLYPPRAPWLPQTAKQ